jgi:UDP-N-acetylmuramoyl-tripeptide--D-alanyl-D-alanine ligase
MSAVLIWIGFVAFAARRLTTYLHLFQQEEYDNTRFVRWLVREQVFDRRLSLALLVLGILQWTVAPAGLSWLLPLLAGLACLGVAALETDPRKNAKKRLVMTARAKRIYGIALALLAVLGVVIALATDWVLVWLLPVQVTPLALVAANLILAPFEQRVQRRYWAEAHDKLGRLRPTVIGITGSYGKTSVKHILGHVLESAGPTLITPGSVNTAMGIARIVRERLAPHHRYFVAEMGAYGIGSIHRLCDLAPPDLGIITAIGKAHYERFKSLEGVAQAKFELAEAALAKGGKTIVADDTLGFPASSQFAAAHPEALVTVGDAAECTLMITDLRQEADGLVVSVRWEGAEYQLRAPLYGLHQGRNVALAFTAACMLGMVPEDVVASLKSVPQIAHRLEVKRQGGAVLIDDAYNSNPVGFASALGLLDVLRQPGGRRILVTPGMVELGAEHDAEHSRIGRLAATHVDVLLAVAPHRVAALSDAFRQAAPQAELVSCDTFADAQAWLDRNLAAHDAVLIENDLPDLYERPLRL